MKGRRRFKGGKRGGGRMKGGEREGGEREGKGREGKGREGRRRMKGGRGRKEKDSKVGWMKGHGQ